MRYDPPSHVESAAPPRGGRGRGPILLGILLLVASTGFAAFAVVEGFADLVPAERGLVPGVVNVTVEEPGAHTVYFEPKSVVGGTPFETTEDVEGLACSLSGPAGSTVPLAAPSARSTYEDNLRGFRGFSIFEFDAVEAGPHRLDCDWQGAAARPAVLAVGKDGALLAFGALVAALALGALGTVLLVAGIAARARRPENL